MGSTGRGSRPVDGKIPRRSLQITCRACGLSASMECAYRDVAPTIFDCCPRCRLSRGRPHMAYNWAQGLTVTCPSCGGEHPMQAITGVAHGEEDCYLEIGCGIDGAVPAGVLVRT